MATITLKFNARNKLARNTIRYILSLGVFEKITGLDEALEDVKKGNVYSAKNAKELINQCLK